jgi:hypothetical protein
MGWHQYTTSSNSTTLESNKSDPVYVALGVVSRTTGEVKLVLVALLQQPDGC